MLKGTLNPIQKQISLFDYMYIGQTYLDCEAAWTEQRDVLDYAYRSIQTEHPLQGIVKVALEDITPKRPDLTGMISSRSYND